MASSVSQAPFRGVVFDMNGTLVDDIPFHLDAWRSIASELGTVMGPEDFQAFNGMKNEDIVPRLAGPGLAATRIAELVERKESGYRSAYQPHLALLPGARELLERLRAAKIPVAIASSAPPENRALVIEGLGLHAYVDVVVAAENLPGKPEPHVFLEAARRLGVPPEACLAFEDAVAGVTSAVRAGMAVGAVTTNNPAATLLGAGARWTMADFTQMPGELRSRLP